MKSLGCLVLLCLLPVHADALLIRFDNTTYTGTDITVDWSDGLLTGASGYNYRASQPEGWGLHVDRNAYPLSFLNFYISCPLPEGVQQFCFALWWQDPVPITTTLNHYDIWSDDIRFLSQSASAITFHLDRDPVPSEPVFVAVPESGSSMLLLLIGLAAVAWFRHKARGESRCGLQNDCAPDPVSAGI